MANAWGLVSMFVLFDHLGADLLQGARLFRERAVGTLYLCLLASSWKSDEYIADDQRDFRDGPHSG
jgi:hypothetical protein